MNPARWERRAERMRARAEAAEALLEEKSLALYKSNELLRQLAADLDRRVRVKTAELRAARDEAEHANRSKSAFLASMSHELRTPLTAILGYTELMIERDEEEPFPEGSTDDLDCILESARHLLTLISDVLDLSKVEAGKLQCIIETVRVRDVLEEVQNLMQPRAKTQDTQIDVVQGHESEWARADRVRLLQCVLNLVSNAVKFTASGRVLLHAAREADRVTIRVLDTGPGMLPAQTERLFTPFGQATAMVQRTHGGTGLGLMLTRQLMQAMDGGVELEWSTPGLGSSFVMWIPAADEMYGESSDADLDLHQELLRDAG